MPLYAGPSFCDQDVCIGSPDPERLGTMPKAADILDAVTSYLNTAPTRSDIYYFCMYRQGTPVRQIILHDIDWQTGESLVAYHLFLPEYRGRGIGTTALALLQRYVHSKTSLRRLIVITSRDNQASQRIATKCRFELIGPAREDSEQLLVFGWNVPHILAS